MDLRVAVWKLAAIKGLDNWRDPLRGPERAGANGFTWLLSLNAVVAKLLPGTKTCTVGLRLEWPEARLIALRANGRVFKS